MRLARLLPPRWQKIFAELTKFGVVGVINTLIDFLIFNLFLPIGPLKSKVVSTVVATTASYAMNRQWTFKHRDRTGIRREYVLFFLLNLVGLVIQLAVLGAAKYGLGFTEQSDRLALNIANAGGIAVATVFRFWAYRTFVFTRRPVPAVTTPVAGAGAPVGGIPRGVGSNRTAGETAVAGEVIFADAGDDGARTATVRKVLADLGGRARTRAVR